MRPTKYTKDILEPLVKEARSVNQVCKKLGIKVSGATHIKSLIKRYSLDTSHFVGQAWLKGQTNERISDDKFFAPKTHKPDVKVVRRRMLRNGWRHECELCSITNVWQNKPLTLHVDHRNGNRLDYSRGNLRFLCPNCHQQTDTWGDGNKGKKMTPRATCQY